LTGELSAAHEAGEPTRNEYEYYPTEWRSPYIERRRKTGWALYALAGIERGDREAGERQRGRNYTFFGAPVGLIFVIDRYLERGSWLDFGMFLQNIMVAARSHGLDTCAQAALANFPAIARRHLAIPDDQMIICGMALGRADPDEATNTLITDREELSAFVTIHE
jgi:nitroreductase